MNISEEKNPGSFVKRAREINRERERENIL